MYEMFEIVPIGLPAAGSDSVRSSDEANSLVVRMKTAVETSVAARAASRPQWVRIVGSDRRSPLRSTGRKAPLNAATKLGRGAAAAAGAAALAAFDEAPPLAGASSSSTGSIVAACSARWRRRASVRSVRFARANEGASR